jgi:serine/threonine-protein kinase
VHGDIKPENILVTTGRDVKIMNFGIAPIPTRSSTQSGAILGIPGSGRYMAPEQVVGGHTDGRTDIFSLGVVLYEMLTGVTPFDGDKLGTIPDKVLKEVPVPPSTLNIRVQPAFDRIVSRALAKHPRDRYQTALEFARDVQNPDAYRPAVCNETAIAVWTIGTRAGQQDALIAVPPALGAGIKEIAASTPGKAGQRRKPLLLAIPTLLIAAFVIYSQGHQRHQQPRDEPAAAVPKPAVSAPPADSGSPVSRPPTAPAKSKLAARPKAPARPSVSANAPDGPVSPSVPPSPVSVTQANATISLAISPWGEVYVDGKSVGISPPLTTLRLEAGTHRVEIRNQEFEPYRDTVNLEPDEPLRIKHKFR